MSLILLSVVAVFLLLAFCIIREAWWSPEPGILLVEAFLLFVALLFGMLSFAMIKPVRSEILELTESSLSHYPGTQIFNDWTSNYSYRKFPDWGMVKKLGIKGVPKKSVGEVELLRINGISRLTYEVQEEKYEIGRNLKLHDKKWLANLLMEWKYEYPGGGMG